jgi:hypothetical protein
VLGKCITFAVNLICEYMNIAIIATLKRHGVMIKTIAERLSVRRNTIYYYDRQADGNSISTLERIAQAAGIPLIEFLPDLRAAEGGGAAEGSAECGGVTGQAVAGSAAGGLFVMDGRDAWDIEDEGDDIGEIVGRNNVIDLVDRSDIVNGNESGERAAAVRAVDATSFRCPCCGRILVATVRPQPTVRDAGGEIEGMYD